MSSSNELNILLAINNLVARQAVRCLLQNCPYQINGYDPDDTFDFSCIDLILFNALQPVEPLRTKCPNAKLIVLDTGISTQDIKYLLVAEQVRGIISPDHSVEMFFKALRLVAQGEVWLDQHYLKSLLNNTNGTFTKKKALKTLSDQDRKIISHIVSGARNQDIADEICLSVHTVKSHISKIYKKLGVKNRAQLVAQVKPANLLQLLSD